MKYFLFILPLLILWLTWCSQKQPHSPLPISTDSLDIVVENTDTTDPNDQNTEILEWSLDTPIFITQDNFTIIQSGDVLNYNNIFSITLPTWLHQWEYFHLPYHVLSLFSNDSSYKSFAISVWEQIANAWSLSEEERCVYSYKMFPQAWSTVTTTSKIVDGHTLYITQSLYHEWSNNIQLCFIDYNLTHKILIGNYDLKYAYHILDSFIFFN